MEIFQMIKEHAGLFSKEELTFFLQIAPFHAWLKLEIGELMPDGLEIIMPVRPEIISIPEPQQVVHGGILGSLVDLAGLYAVLYLGGQPSGTAYMHVDYHRQATSGPLHAKSRVLKIGKTISTAETRIYSTDGALLASGSSGYPRSAKTMDGIR
jgi:uncharacterized protein (TIGR00369 family)